MQNDFCEGGSLPVTGGAQVAADIAAVLRAWPRRRRRPAYDHVVATKDHHVDPGDHWSREPDFVDSWPVHCQVGTAGEAFHPNLDPQPFDAIFTKGEHAAAYSGFEGRTATAPALADWLRAREVTRVDVCGIATDHCVRATALDAARARVRDHRAARPVRRRGAGDDRGGPGGDARGGREPLPDAPARARPQAARSG